VARNRKRAKDRRARRPGDGAEPGIATAGFDAPDPIEHSAPDVELAEAQLALGRPELAGEPGAPDEFEDYEDEARENELELEREELESEEEEEAGFDGDGGEPPSGGELVAPGGPTPSPGRREFPGNRLINFIQGSWRELQRVQWPDRRQVMQATGVVIGFVIVAGVFLGVADFVAGKLVNYILK